MLPTIIQAPQPHHTKVTDLLDELQSTLSQDIAGEHKAQLGQFFTPLPIARFMASLLECSTPSIAILDAGAGVGMLFAACVSMLCERSSPPKTIHVTAYEIDPGLISTLQSTMRQCEATCAQRGIAFTGEVIQADFIESAVQQLAGGLFAPLEPHRYTCAILNPPYHKIQSRSLTRKRLAQMDIETSNLYAGFVAVALQWLAPHGELVAITPRSFCNGPYFAPFRRQLLEVATLRHLHIFDSRQDVFRQDEVLQENIIFSVRKQPTTPLANITLSSSEGMSDLGLRQWTVPWQQVIQPKDPQAFIHIVPPQEAQNVADRMRQMPCSLADLRLSVSTGRVVEFRAKAWLRQQPGVHTAPLVYPAHLTDGEVLWPKRIGRKSNALASEPQSATLVVPNENYVLVKRFTAKEERRRVVAAVYESQDFPGDAVGFENHLNYMHCAGQGLPIMLARGLAAYLNSTLVDKHVRHFNGHTQVNATDLRQIRYPTRQQLEALGRRITSPWPNQAALDRLVKEELFGMTTPTAISSDPIKKRIAEGVTVLKALGFSPSLQNDRSALTLLALLGLQPESTWSAATAPLLGITPIIEFIQQAYSIRYAPNTRETIRDETMQHFVEAALVIKNPDKPDRATNSPRNVYQIESAALELLRLFETTAWESSLITYLASRQTLQERYAQIRHLARIPVTINGQPMTLSAGGQNVLIQQILEGFAPRFTPGGEVLYVGDTAGGALLTNQGAFTSLGIALAPHSRMPDVIVHYPPKNWLLLIEAVTSNGSIDAKRRIDLERLFAGSSADLVYVTAFANRKALAPWLDRIAWDTEVWLADAPDHLIHFNGDRFLGRQVP